MSKDNTTDLTLKVHNSEPGTHVQTQYGVTLPDGTNSWTSVAGEGYVVSIQHMLDPKTSSSNRLHYQEQWKGYLRKKAAAANMNADAYGELHKFIKRTVVLAVTEVEEA